MTVLQRTYSPLFVSFRKKREYRHSATSWLRDRLYATAADLLRARIRTTTPRHPHPNRIPNLCFPRPVTPTQPRTITPSLRHSPTPLTCTRRTARWAAITVTTARSHCCINKRGTGGRGRQSHSAHGGHKTPQDTVTFTCFGDEHSSVETLFWNTVWKHKYIQGCALHLAASESHAGNTRPHSFDLTVFSPTTRHLWLVEVATSTSQTIATLEVFLKVECTDRSLNHSSPSFVISFRCGDTASRILQGKVCVCVFAISSPPFVSRVRWLDKHIQ